MPDDTGKVYNILKVIACELRQKKLYYQCECLLCGRVNWREANNVRAGYSTSCGCTRRKPNGPTVRCEICGDEFEQFNKRHRKCKKCKGKYKYTCKTCGKEYIGRAENAGYCPDCLSVYLSTMRMDKKKNIKDRQAFLETCKTPERIEKINEIRPLAEKAHRESPVHGPYETNMHAKYWCIQSPWGENFEVRNLFLFMRDHPDWFPNLESARTAIMGFQGRVEKGRAKKTDPAYKGWYLLWSDSKKK